MTVPPDEQTIHVSVAEEQRELASLLAREVVGKLLGGEKVVGRRIRLARVKPALVKTLVSQAWQAKAPKSRLKK